jgi:hypothetical protein
MQTIEDPWHWYSAAKRKKTHIIKSLLLLLFIYCSFCKNSFCRHVGRFLLCAQKHYELFISMWYFYWYNFWQMAYLFKCQWYGLRTKRAGLKLYKFCPWCISTHFLHLASSTCMIGVFYTVFIGHKLWDGQLQIFIWCCYFKKRNDSTNVPLMWAN